MRPLGTNALRRSRATLVCSVLLLFSCCPTLRRRHPGIESGRHSRWPCSRSPWFTQWSTPWPRRSCQRRRVFCERSQRRRSEPPTTNSEEVRPRLPRPTPPEDYKQENERDGGAQPIRVAYQSAQRVPVAGPGTESDDDYYQDQDQDQEQERGSERADRKAGRSAHSRGSRAVFAKWDCLCAIAGAGKCEECNLGGEHIAPQTLRLGRRPRLVLRLRLRLLWLRFVRAPWRGAARGAAALERSHALRRTRARPMDYDLLATGPYLCGHCRLALRYDRFGPRRGCRPALVCGWARHTRSYIARHPAGF